MTQRVRVGPWYSALVDDEDLDLVQQYHWNAQETPTAVYAYAQFGPRRSRTKVFMHRLLFPDAVEVDHVNGDGLDNRRTNLRPCTRKQNGRNMRKHVDGSSTFKGVSLDHGTGWRARIWDGEKEIYLGRFATEIEAAEAYDRASRQIHGEWGRTNESVEAGGDATGGVTGDDA